MMMPPQLDNPSDLDCSSATVTESETVELPAAPSAFYTGVNVAPGPEHCKQGLASTISDLEEEMSALISKQKYLVAKRRQALDRMLDIKGNIRVFCRIRPIENKRLKSAVVIEPEKIDVRSVGVKKEFVLDRVFSQESTQEDVFQEVHAILRSALDGHNVCIFAYGQTGTGKTYTMEGTDEKPGIVPRAIKELFHHITEDKSVSFTVSMSMLEIYMGNLRDLLAHRQSSSRTIHSVPKCNLNILNSGNGTVEIEGLRDVELANLKQATRWYAKGKRARSTSWTNVNETSSRSHCLYL